MRTSGGNLPNWALAPAVLLAVALVVVGIPLCCATVLLVRPFVLPLLLGTAAYLTLRAMLRHARASARVD